MSNYKVELEFFIDESLTTAEVKEFVRGCLSGVSYCASRINVESVWDEYESDDE